MFENVDYFLFTGGIGSQEIENVTPGAVLIETAGIDILKDAELRQNGASLVNDRGLFAVEGSQVFEQGGFAGSAGADEGDFLALMNRQGNFFERFLFLVEKRKVAQLTIILRFGAHNNPGVITCG